LTKFLILILILLKLINIIFKEISTVAPRDG
jgi:hypothetical protein